MLKGNPVTGARYLLRGTRMLTEPGLRRFVIIPLLINILLFVSAIYLLVQQFSLWVGYWLSFMPDWLSFLDWLLWPLFALLVLVTVYFGFGVVANLIAAPFNGLLAERVEERLRGVVSADTGWSDLLATVPGALWREVAKMGYFAPRFVGVFVLSLIPVLNMAAPLLWFLFGAWMMAIQYCDYPMDNNRVSFSGLRDHLRSQRLSSLGFGSLVALAMLVPVVNLLVMPAAVIGATIFWVEQFAIPASGDDSDARLT